VRTAARVHAAGAAQSDHADRGEVEMSARAASVAGLILGLSLGAAAQAGGSRVGVAVVVPFGPVAPVAPVFAAPVAPVFVGAPVVPMLATTIVQPPLAPMLAPSFVPGFVPVSPQFVAPVVVAPMVVAPMVVAPAVVAPVVPVWPVPAVIPHVPVVAPGAPLFFAPPVQTVISPAFGGPVIIIPGSGF
jgi:hypothetical protein